VFIGSKKSYQTPQMMLNRFVKPHRSQFYRYTVARFAGVLEAQLQVNTPGTDLTWHIPMTVGISILTVPRYLLPYRQLISVPVSNVLHIPSETAD